MELTRNEGYQQLLDVISAAYAHGQASAVEAVNVQLVETYWQVGRHIVEFEQGGSSRAGYGKELINTLATDLGPRHGKGFSRSNLVYMRLLYLRYPISQKPSHPLSWSHYVELLKFDDELERGFYEKQAISERWSVPELKRQKASLFSRLAASKDREGILQLEPPENSDTLSRIWSEGLWSAWRTGAGLTRRRGVRGGEAMNAWAPTTSLSGSAPPREHLLWRASWK